MTGGIVVAAVAMAGLGMSKTFGQEAEGLVQVGLYRASRNPQIVGGALMVVGVGLLWPSWFALGWVVLYGCIGHMMVVSEEEHLRRVHGEAYERYCERVPRYVGFSSRTKKAVA
ncbi:MAG: isoprenylcysteine carboxylmethyltransferase family protein [Ignavibacteria bacterium]|nr:isoprenylcysteine carboxylmethyltransferase family protein [Ignavibacteria bacterium]